MAFEFTDANFSEKTQEGITLVDFWATWCGPCRMIAPIVEELAEDFEGKALIGKMDVDANSKIPLQFGVRSIPTIIIFKDGVEVARQVGVTTKSVLQKKLDEQLVIA